MPRKLQVAGEPRPDGRGAEQTDGTSRADPLHDRRSDAIGPHKRRRRVKITGPAQQVATVVTLPTRGRMPHLEHGEPQISKPQPTLRCVFSASAASSVVKEPAFQIAKYFVAGEAEATDSVTFQGGTITSRFRVVPIFYGTSWLGSAPAYRDVVAAIKTLMDSPYLWELDQYGFESLEVLSPVLVTAMPAGTHNTDQVADIVASLLTAGSVPAAGSGDALIYTVFYPSGTSVDIDACGWHYDASGNWIVAVEFPDNATTSQVALDNILRIFSHELVETITDPSGKAPKEGWVMNRKIHGGTEIGDACNATDDFTAGVFVNAYWSERSKACVIPQPNCHVLVNSNVVALNETLVSTGSVTFLGDPLDIRTCLNGTYTYSNTFLAQRAHFKATTTHFPTTPSFTWAVEDAGGMNVFADGTDTIVGVDVDSWTEGPNGAAHSQMSVPVHVIVAGDELTVIADNIGVDYVNFAILVQVTATAGAYSATALGRELLDCQRFDWDDDYKAAMQSCRDRLRKLILEAVQLVRFTDKGDPLKVWTDRITSIVTGERAELAAQSASVAAAIEASHPELSAQLRGLAAVVCQVPAALLMRTPKQLAKSAKTVKQR